MELLVSLASVAAMRIRNVSLAQEAAERRLLQKELDLARQIQVALLPSSLPEVAGYELRAGNIPSRGVSGDFYKVVSRTDDRECVVMLADVSGKGMAASLLTASLEALSAPLIESGASPVEISSQVSRLLFERTPPEKYATCFLAALEVDSGRLTYVNAGHNPGLLLGADGDCRWLASTGVPIGVLEHGPFEQKVVELAPGDAVLLYTDGITEAANPGDEEYGEDRLREVAATHRDRSLEELAAAVEADVDAFVCGTPYADDRTLVMVRRRS
jgi:sigma-B regulation protein RsbU (phosphoserine phosphatase)